MRHILFVNNDYVAFEGAKPSKDKITDTELKKTKALAKEEAEKLAAAEKAQAEYLASEEYLLEVEFQSELKAEEAAAIEGKRQAFMKKRKAQK